MEKTKLMKVFLVILVSVALVFATTSVFAADNTSGFTDITNTLNNTNTNNSNSNTNNTNTNNANTNTNNTNANNANTNTNNTNANTNNAVNSSSYNNTNLPKTGIAETGSVVCIVFALAVSAIYAFKKILDYKNV